MKRVKCKQKPRDVCFQERMLTCIHHYKCMRFIVGPHKGVLCTVTFDDGFHHIIDYSKRHVGLFTARKSGMGSEKDQRTNKEIEE